MTDDLLVVNGLEVGFPSAHGGTRALDRVSLSLRRGQSVGIVGRSGAGKSILASTLMGLLRKPGRVLGGTAIYQGKNVLDLSEEQWTRLRGSEIALIPNSPRSRLNPVLVVGKQLVNVIMAKQSLTKRQAKPRAIELLSLVAIADPERVFDLLPSELSGGMCQRVLIAMALSHSPRLLLADEPTAGLDVTIQKQILETMAKRVRETGTSLLLMTRDMGIVAHYCDRVAVLKEGRIVEDRPVRAFFENPQHSHSLHLLQSSFAAQGANEESA